ncbi:immunodominant staphylococcal antigen IsaB family protein [Staphylococcus carnosus]|uniref:Immunodominant staphylococcal antigen B n=1 Tax=Staphylococcus carnosus (strain TM300) TaxID=396513 RepID=B9DIF7_STACT|nr:hypothetical protein [Staphylococcus carnosus]KOR12638.1 hypothetical protein AMC75_09215 [Staphylococcus carnosus]QPT03078.1 hypothetical protein I6G40_08120 [Staphylococcus carnosus]UQA68081.1 hypothetical protein Sta3580_04150 [Staphylococcus carnosus]UTB77098.1 hypothetical protein A2I62_00255 [Staphylococcus carnosus]UTB86648.1 hypothetical protein A2I63_00250 [Staphylococcus carnosus]
MKKVIAATGVTLTLALSASVLPANNDAGNEAHAATQPYYNYTGYTANDSSFFVDPNFVRAVKYHNVTFNGYKIQGQHQAVPNSTKNIQVYDQLIAINKETNNAVSASFPINQGQISREAIENAYGTDYEFASEKNSKDTGMMTYEFDGSTVNIEIYHNMADSATIT